MGMKKIVLSLIIISLLILPSCKKVAEDNYNIVGTWDFKFLSDNQSYTEQMIFVGSETTGVVTDGYSTGAYTVLNNSVTFSIMGWSTNLEVTITITFLGKFDSKNSMSGSFITNYADLFPDEQGTWTANR